MRLLRHFPFALSVADAAVAARMRAAGSTVALSWHEGHTTAASLPRRGARSWGGWGSGWVDYPNLPPQVPVAIGSAGSSTHSDSEPS